MEEKKIYDFILFAVIVFSLIFTSISASSISVNSNKNSFKILGCNPDMDKKELDRLKTALLDDVCDDCDDDDDDIINKKPSAFIYEVSPNPAREYETVSFEGYGEDEDGEIIAYAWQSDIDDTISEDAAFTTNSLSKGIHLISFYVKDDANAWSEPADISLEIIQNSAPITPVIGGKTSGKTGTELDYNFITTDPEGHNIFYYIEWGDNLFEDWIGPYQTDEEVTLSHTWDEDGSYTIRAKAKDSYDAESDWETFSIQMSKSKTTNSFIFNQFINIFLKQYPMLLHLLN